MNWYWNELFKEAGRGQLDPANVDPKRWANSPQWKGRVFTNFVRPLMRNKDAPYNKIVSILRTAKNAIFPFALMPLREDFHKSLDELFQVLLKRVPGDALHLRHKCAQEADKLLDLLIGGVKNNKEEVMNRLEGHAATSQDILFARARKAYEQYVKPLLKEPLELDKWRQAVQSGVGRMQQLGLDATKLSEYRQMRGYFVQWDAATKSPTPPPPEQLEELGRKLAEAFNRWYSFGARNTSKVKDMFMRYIAPNVPERYRPGWKSYRRFVQDLVASPSAQKGLPPKTIQWRRENKELLQQAWASPPYEMPDGSLSAPLQKLINHIKEGHAAFARPQEQPPQPPAEGLGNLPEPTPLSPLETGTPAEPTVTASGRSWAWEVGED